MTAPTIVKADGSVERFNPALLADSLVRAGAGRHAAERIAEKITASLAPGATSKQIYRRAFALLRQGSARPVAARYALRRALLEFGPSGHPFEDFISRLFAKEGWQVETRKMIKGHCVTHEVDFYASHPGKGEYMAAELKYHNDPGYKTDLKIALYVKSRFDDIFACDPAVRACPIDRGLLVTNTKFSSEAIAYAECAGVELLGWSYPVEGNLFDRMCRAKVYPVTTLTTLTTAEKRLLIGERIVAADELLESRSALARIGFSAARIGEVFAEAEELIALPHPADMP
ncbi:MAG: restriction endonuclease [Patescibacteria group bacterium]|nr:restriction endonuclease [Patescibacteria group bacterium]MDE1943888.1 restriction endonuclease [Patescibacteria group bacterium]MDE1945179.1 restriction endonuclease [Patescibacteria group bacterium]MDE2057428.1 restriction endonuclease [Patescibacteria group bacterium]